MADTDKLANMQPGVLHKLHFAVAHNLEDLEAARSTGRISTVAWLVRNLLELAIWTAHCAQSESNSKQFVLDAARDVHDAMNVPDGIFTEDFSFRDARTESIQQARDAGFETLDESFKRVSNVAQGLGRGQEFKSLNKLLSKFAHPTALSVIDDNSKANEVLKQKLFSLGHAMAKRTLIQIEDVLAK